MSEVSEIERVVDCIVNNTNEVPGPASLESEIADAAWVFHRRIGAVEAQIVSLNQIITEQFGQVHDKLDLLMLMAIDEGVTAKVEAQTKLLKQGFCLVIFMLIVCYMQYSRHMQWVKEVADQPRETPGWRLESQK